MTPEAKARQTIDAMLKVQRRRFFPLPDYDLSQPERVMVTLRGRILDVRYTRLLMASGSRRSHLDKRHIRR